MRNIGVEVVNQTGIIAAEKNGSFVAQWVQV